MTPVEPDVSDERLAYRNHESLVDVELVNVAIRDEQGVILGPSASTATERAQAGRAEVERGPDGLDSQQISDRPQITIRTEQHYVTNILTKLDVHSRLQALVPRAPLRYRRDRLIPGSSHTPPARFIVGSA